VVAHQLGTHRRRVQTDRYLQRRHGQGFLKPCHTFGLLAQSCSSAVHFCRKQRVIEGPPSDLHGTPKLTEPSSSMVMVTNLPPSHTDNWKGDGGSVLPSLLCYQHSTGEENRKERLSDLCQEKTRGTLHLL